MRPTKLTATRARPFACHSLARGARNWARSTESPADCRPSVATGEPTTVSKTGREDGGGHISLSHHIPPPGITNNPETPTGRIRCLNDQPSTTWKG
jgi:hypothetical protein